jgi:hypothetical protein
MLTVCLRIRLKGRATIFVAAPLLRAACTDDRAMRHACRLAFGFVVSP